MRKREPSSALLSKDGAMDLNACRTFAVSEAVGARTSRAAAPGAARSRARPKAEAQVEGKSGPAAPAWNSAPRKCAFRCCLTASSSRKSPRSERRYSGLASGGTKPSPSSRLSDKCGLYNAFNQFTSSGAKTEPFWHSKLDQKALPNAPQASGNSLPSSPGASAVGVERLKLSKLRSTPRGWRGATTAPPVISAKETYAPGSSAMAEIALKRGAAANSPTRSSTPN
mmetsp:Transcript_131018/g.407468  ORF Transcript_131018/g.407468 Transcript_131018/m.407468 type:complete len:226 (-) Transcript_131018:134-811(-)